ncbi:hypothetical protein LTR20_004651 [Exophiala xenobiotica]|nr:hypothetical protein LTR40_008057 [Exophiala xenobiotica]KAK5388353.1 hypothetical protein LTS13_001289 [Exophiala xenobiotica]KAK5398442.1 hypothetical protein LTR79_004724 [Exophiala xenobiotica]KAK5417488.1 hypothetical protein LTR90_004662 [Exophiala xenobiotica]KAK5463945.1 hypothetical protein LTR20_004651 [Exophiala xenobiotica]
MSMVSSRGSSYSESFDERQSKNLTAMWNPEKNLVTMTSLDLMPELHRRDSMSTEASNSTLAMDAPHDELDPKTPTVREIPLRRRSPSLSDASSDVQSDHVAGPMEQLLQSLLRKVTEAERSRPTIMAEDYAKLQARVDALEGEKKTWESRYQAYFDVRDQDLTNILKLRTMLADERREHTAIKKLRDEDLENLLSVRHKLAQALWSKPEPQRPTSTVPSGRQSRTEGVDLWQAAKTAAMEHRLLELEAANKELHEQAATGGSSTDASKMMSRMENMFEDSLKQREKMASKVQQLRSEKEALQKEVAVLEDQTTELEGVIERLQRNCGI